MKTDQQIIEISMRDLFIQVCAKNAKISFDNLGNGNLRVYDTPVYNKYDIVDGTRQPSFYFTHDRTGQCIESTITNIAILNLMGYKTKEFVGAVDGVEGHHWAEAIIDGIVYVVNYNALNPRGDFYEVNGWTTDPSYDPNWHL